MEIFKASLLVLIVALILTEYASVNIKEDSHPAIRLSIAVLVGLFYYLSN